MEKILNDKLNEIKSKYKQYITPKLDKRYSQDNFILQDFRSKISEIELLLKKIKDEKSK